MASLRPRRALPASRRVVGPVLAGLLTLAASLLAGPAQARADDDAWLGHDKALHFGASAGLAAGGYAVASLWLEPRWARASVGAGVALGAGVGKELWDAAGHGDPSERDLAWDVAGTAVGVAVALLIDHLLAP